MRNNAVQTRYSAVQKAVNELVWIYGKDVEQSPQYEELLDEFGLDSGDVDGSMIEIAVRVGTERHERNMKKSSVKEREMQDNGSDTPNVGASGNKKKPKRETEVKSVITLSEHEARQLLIAWGMRAEAYKFDRVVSRLNDQAREIYNSSKAPDDEEAVAQMERIVQTVENGGTVDVIPEGTVAKPKTGTPVPVEGKNGHDSAKRGRGRPKKAEAMASAASTASSAAFKRPGRPKGHSEGGNVSTRGKRGRPAGTSNPEPTRGLKKDKFGTRVGTPKAKFNSVLTRRPKKVSELVQEAGIEVPTFTYTDRPSKPTVFQFGDYYRHLKKLVQAGHVEKVGTGYALVKTK